MPADPPPPAGSDDPDAERMQRFASGETDAFIELVRRHQNPLLNFFVRMGAYQDGEDLVQETFLRIFRYGKKYRPKARFTTFLYVVARHVWADRCRRRMRRERLAEAYRTEVETGGAAAGGARRQPEMLDVQAAIERLPRKLRETLVLNAIQGLSYEETARVLGVPLGTVKSRMHNALKNVREWMDEDA